MTRPRRRSWPPSCTCGSGGFPMYAPREHGTIELGAAFDTYEMALQFHQEQVEKIEKKLKSEKKEDPKKAKLSGSEAFFAAMICNMLFSAVWFGIFVYVWSKMH